MYLRKECKKKTIKKLSNNETDIKNYIATYFIFDFFR